MKMQTIRTRSGWAVALGTTLVVSVACTSSTSSTSEDTVEALPGNNYTQTNLAATGESYSAPFTLPDMVNAWGVAIRPKGAGGHFWVGAGGTSYEFVGDVTASPDPALRQLHQDGLKEV
ncbi:hypothetical protein SAMN05444583_117112, partial [Rhodococcus maanshanensis]